MNPNKPPRYFKITNEKEYHRGYQYHDGLNEDDNHNLYFTDLDNLHYFFDSGINLREVTVPLDSEVYISGNQLRANKIILGIKRPLNNLSTIRYLIMSGIGGLRLGEYEIKTLNQLKDAINTKIKMIYEE